jgi:membrane protease YdiL (CAAX protease family)
MKPCGYCGRENDEDSTYCSGCGSSLASSEGAEPLSPCAVEQSAPGTAEQLSPIACEQLSPGAAGQLATVVAEQPSPGPAGQRLSARSATFILLVYFAAQFVVGVGAAIAAVSLADVQGRHVEDPAERKQIVRAISGPATVLGFVAGGVAVLVMSQARIRPYLADTSSTGAAWVPGSFKHVAQGMVTGALLGGCYCALTTNFQGPSDQEMSGPIATMAATPGLQRLLWLFLLLVLAPIVEELLFRGVLYGGYRSSFGPIPAAVLTTAIFWALHLTETIHFWPAMFSVAGLAMVALWFRLRSAAIGPAVAVHFGYNRILAAVVLSSMGR